MGNTQAPSPSAYDRFGAVLLPDGVLFRIWTATEGVELVVEGDPRSPFSGFQRNEYGIRELFVPGLGAGARYGYLLDGHGPFPDPASRYQPEGVHALSEVIDPAFRWTDTGFAAAPLRQAVIYELHFGTFTTQGTFSAARRKLADLQSLGITALEIMPIADFAGSRNWGYDGVSLYAPSWNYGRPEEFRAFVDEAHHRGLAVYLDVVYNHFGPDGAYHRLFHPAFYSLREKTHWGESLNFDGPESENVRAFFIGNALHWRREYHIDGFRLDATHAIHDESQPHFLAEFAAALHGEAEGYGRPPLVIAEDARNLARLLKDSGEDSYGLDAVWADDLHHQVRRALAGDHEGYYADYDGSVSSIVRTLRNGWFYEGQYSQHHGAPRGTPSGEIDRSRFVVCIQNHDQIGNRARGERLNHQTSLEAYRAAAALLLLAPETPLLFMGQEWAASSPFQFFTDHNAYLGPMVTEGRIREFSHFSEFADPAARATIPDPQNPATFFASKLQWQERELPLHAAALRWYRRLIALRTQLLAEGRSWSVQEIGGAIVMEWKGAVDTLVSVVNLTIAAHVALPSASAPYHLAFTSEDPEYVPAETDQPLPPVFLNSTAVIEFLRPGCAVLRTGKERSA